MNTPDPPVPVQELPYAAPPLPRSTFSWAAFFSTVLVVGLVAFVLLLIVPVLKGFYRSIHMQVPLPTQLLLAVSDWATNWGWTSFPVVPVVFALIAPRVAPRRESRTATEYARQVDRLTVLVIVLAAAFAVLLIFTICGFMPMITTFESISR